VALIVGRAAGAARLSKVTREELDEVRTELRTTWDEYQQARPTFYQLASKETQHLFAEPTTRERLDGAVPNTLFLLDALARRRASARVAGGK
jgi:hypothetical protein